MRRLWFLSVACILSLTVPGRSDAEIDTRRIGLSSQYPDPVAWLNVEGSPFWVGGARPRYSFDDESHSVDLEPGEEVRLILPTGEGILVRGDPEQLGTLEWSTSNGSGLWAQATAEKTTNADQVLLPFSMWETRLVAIRHPVESEQSIRVALFVSRRDRGIRIRFERESIPLDAVRRTLFLGLQHQAGPLYELTPRKELAVEVQGPHRYLLEHRVFYPHEVSDRRFSYRVELRAGERSSESEFVAFPQVRDLSTVDLRTRVVGRLMRSYIDVAAGHQRLTIRTDAPLLARLLGPFDEVRAAWAQETEATVEGSAWLSDWSAIEADAISDPRSNAHQRALLRIARDNRRIDSGLLAAERAIAEARSMPNLPSLRRFAQTLAIGQIGYRGLPARRGETPSSEESRSYLFITSGLRSPVDDRDRYVLGDQHATSLRRQALSGRFVPLPAPEEELVYFLPERSVASRLRLALQPRGREDDTCRLSINLGGDRRVNLRSGSVPDPNLLDVGAAEVATSLQTASGDIPGDVAGLGWSSETSNAEFELPESTNVVRVRSTDCEGRRVALAYGVGRKDSMNEAEYRAAVSAIGGPPAATQLFSAALANLDALLDGTDPLAMAVSDAAGEWPWQRAASARLLNHWAPSLQLIRARNIAYRHLLEDPVETIDAIPTEDLSPEKLERLRSLAKDLERSRHWLAAYQTWMKIVTGSPPETARKVKLRAVDALLESGESRLAAMILKSEVLQGPAETPRSQAFDRLVEIYHRQGNDVALEGLLASRAVAIAGDARSVALARFSELALEQGKQSLALGLDLILPETHSDPLRRTEAAYLKGWWTTFEESLAELEPAAANRWRGYRSQQAGNFGEARRYWRDADEAGKSALESLDDALSIRDDLIGGTPEERHHALQRWAGWRRNLPGRRIWKQAEDLVVSEDGGERLRSRSLGLFSRWARSTPDRPVRIRVVGPTKLRIDTRPLLTPSSPRMEPSWLVFRTDRRHWRAPLGSVSISTGLERLDDGPENVGTRSRSTLVLEPGIHEIEIFDPRGATLVRIFEERAQLDFAILPNLGPSALDWLEGNSPPPATSAIDCRSFGRLNVCSRPLFRLPETGGSTVVATELKAAFDSNLFENREDEIVEVAWPRLSPAAELPPADAGIEEEFRPARGPQEMTRDTWLIAERNRQPYARLARIGALADLSRTDPLIQSLYGRAMSSFRWRRVRHVVESAGVRLVPQRMGAPFSRGSRKNWPFLSPSCRQSDRLRELGELTVTLENREPKTLTVEIENCHPIMRTPRPASIRIDLDGDTADEIQLDERATTATRSLPIGTGSHSIRISTPSVPSGQTIGVRILENGRPINRERNRAYHVAKPESPLVLEIAGPTRIRIDQLHEGVTRTSYRSLPAEMSRIELTSEGRPEMLYRVARAVRKSEEPPVRRPIPPRPRPIHAPLVIASLDEPIPEPERMTPDRVRPGLEDGTWTVTARYLSRNNNDDDPRSKVSEQMGELRGTHRFRNESWGFYSQGDLFARPRKDGGPTFGGRGRFIWPSFGIWRGFERRATLTTILQPPTDGPNRLEALLGGQVEAALPHAVTAKLQHRPSVALFARWLSLGDRRSYPKENLDRDVFTPYKADHLYGLRLKDSLTLRPYRDVFAKFDLGINSNEDFNLVSPDRLSIGLSGAALYEGMEINGGYRWRHYFEDEDRNEDIDRHDLFLRIQLERWIPLARRWQIGIEARHEISQATTSLVLSLSLHLGRERGFRDFAPDTLRFRSERDLSRRRQTNTNRGRTD